MVRRTPAGRGRGPPGSVVSRPRTLFPPARASILLPLELGVARPLREVEVVTEENRRNALRRWLLQSGDDLVPAERIGVVEPIRVERPQRGAQRGRVLHLDAADLGAEHVGQYLQDLPVRRRAS